MARLALSVGLGIAFSFIPGVGTALGFAIGSALGGLIGSLAFPGKGTHIYGPRVNDLQVSSSAPGQVIPLLWGTMRLGGQVIWSTGLQETTTTQSQSAKGGPSVSQTTYSYSISFASAFAEGPAKITRIWGDSKLIYDVGGSSNPNRGAWSSSTSYSVNDLVTWTDGNTYICMVANTNEPPNNGNYWTQDVAAEDIATSSYNPPTIYPGTETQLPNPLIVSTEGASVTPAYRGTCYAVWEDFPLADFGNRLPNIRAEVTSNGEDVFPANIIPWAFDDTGIPYYVLTDNATHTAWTWNGLNNGGTDVKAARIMRVDLSTNEVVASGSISVGLPLFSSDPSATGGHYNFGPGSDAYPGLDGYMTADVNGTLWSYAYFAGRLGVVTVDPWSFQVLSAIDAHLWTDVGSNDHGFGHFGNELTSVTLSNGGSYIVGVTTDNSGNYTTFVLNLDGSLLGQYYGYGNRKMPQTYPVCDQAGNIYVITEPNLVDGSWQLTKINFLSGAVLPKGTSGLPRGPILTNVENVSFSPVSTRGVPRGMLYNAADNTLVLVTNQGAFLKLDAGSMAIIDEVGSSSNPLFGVTSGGNWYDAHIGPAGQLPYDGFAVGGQGDIVQRAFKGQIQNGIIPVPSLNSDSSGQNVLVYTVSDFSLVSEFNFGSFSASGTPTGYTWPETEAGAGPLVYDPTANALLCTSSTAVPGTSGAGRALYRLYLDRTSINGLTADEIVSDICQQAGIPTDNIDTSMLAGISVEGYPVTSLTSGKDMICTLGQAYFFEGCESDFKLKFVPRGQASVLTIPEQDLGMVEDKCELAETIGQEQDVPKVVQIMYIDPTVDYQQGQQGRIRHSKTTKTINQTSISLPLVMTPVQAAQLADKLMWTAENERRTYKTNLWKAYYMLLDPCDVVEFDYHSLSLTGRVTDNTVGQNFAIATTLTSEDTDNYSSVVTGNNGSGFVGQTISSLAKTLLTVLDMPYLKDTDADASGNMGFYFVLSPDTANGGWAAGVLYNSSDNNSFTQLGASTQKPTYGIAQNALGAPPLGPFTWDSTSTLTLRMSLGNAPTSDTDLNVLNGSNVAIMYPSLEVIQFSSVTTNVDGTITLSRLLRGRRGTDTFTGNHTVGETVFFPLLGGVIHEQVSLSLLNLLRYYKGITVGADLNSNTVSQQVTLQGRDLMPYAPASFYAHKSGSDLLLTWIRRTRIGGAWLDGSGLVNLAEDNESYDLVIKNASGTVVRMFSNIQPPSGPDSWTSPDIPNQLYTAAQQSTDGYSSGHGWTATVYQLSGEVGRGFPSTTPLP
jgi:hypothetical protein